MDDIMKAYDEMASKQQSAFKQQNEFVDKNSRYACSEESDRKSSIQCWLRRSGEVPIGNSQNAQ